MHTYHWDAEVQIDMPVHAEYSGHESATDDRLHSSWMNGPLHDSAYALENVDIDKFDGS
jgi:hypothetical protein